MLYLLYSIKGVNITIKNDFLRIMNNQIEMALATSVNNYPNVRIINFIFDASTNIIFFY